jgi:hypothetical protein
VRVEGVAVNREQMEFLATAELPLRLGLLRLRPSLFAGGGWLSTERASCSDRMPCATPSDGFKIGRLSPRLGAQLGITVPLASWFLLDAGSSFDLAPLSRSSPSFPNGVQHCAVDEPTCWLLPPPGTPPQSGMTLPRAVYALPAEPLYTFQVGVGLRVGWH